MEKSPVSYTHLDVYKRQIHDYPPDRPDGAAGGENKKQPAPDAGSAVPPPELPAEPKSPYSDLLQPDDPDQEDDMPDHTTFIPTDDQIDQYQQELDRNNELDNESEDAAL